MARTGPTGGDSTQATKEGGVRQPTGVIPMSGRAGHAFAARLVALATESASVFSCSRLM